MHLKSKITDLWAWEEWGVLAISVHKEFVKCVYCILAFSKANFEILLCEVMFSNATLLKSCVKKGEPVCSCYILAKSILPEIVQLKAHRWAPFWGNNIHAVFSCCLTTFITASRTGTWDQRDIDMCVVCIWCSQFLDKISKNLLFLVPLPVRTLYIFFFLRVVPIRVEDILMTKKLNRWCHSFRKEYLLNVGWLKFRKFTLF